MASTVGELFVEIVSKGFSKVQSDADAVRKSLEKVDPALKDVQDRLAQPTPVVFARLGSDIDALRGKASKPILLNIPSVKTPELPPLNLGTSKPLQVPVMAEGLDKVQASLDALKPHTLQVPVMAEGLDKVQASLDALKPHDLAVPVMAEGIAKIASDLDKLKGPTVPVQVVAEGLAKAQADLDALRAKASKPIALMMPADKPGTPFGPNEGPQISRWQRFKADTAASYNAPSRLPAPIRAAKAVISGGVGGTLGRGIETRYGPAWGKALKIANAGLMATPIPGAHPIGMAAMLAAAEGHRAIGKMMGKGKEKPAIAKFAPVQVPVMFAPPKNIDKITKGFKPIKVPVEVDERKFSLSGLMKDFGNQFSKGVEKAGTSLADLSSKISSIGSAGAKAFAGATAGILGLFMAADPKGFDNFQLAIYRIQLGLGSFVIPLVRDFTAWLNKLADRLLTVSDATKWMVLGWIKTGLAITGAAAALSVVSYVISKVFGAISGVITVVKLLGTVFSVLASVSPLGLFLLLIGALELLGNSEGFLSGLMDTFKMLYDVIQPIISAALDLGAVMLGWVAGVISAIQPLLPILKALATFILIYKAAVIAGAAATSLWAIVTTAWAAASAAAAVGTGALAGAIGVLQGAFMALLANPIAAGIAAIAVAVMALSGSFSSSSRAMDDLLKKADRLEAIADRLRTGGKLTKKDVAALPSNIKEGLEKTKNDPEARKKFLDEEIAKSKEQEELEKSSEEEQIKIQKKMEEMRSLPYKPFGNRASRRVEALEEIRGRKLTKEEEKKIREISDEGGSVWKKNDYMSDEAIEKMGKILRAKGESAGNTKEILEALKSGQVEEGATKKPGEKGEKEGAKPFPKGEMRAMKPELMSIMEYYNKLLTSEQDSLEARKHQELMRSLDKTGTSVDSIDKKMPDREGPNKKPTEIA